MYNIENLRSKPIIYLTVDEFLFVNSYSENKNIPNDRPETAKKYAYGLKGIAQIINCSIPTAARIKASGKIDEAITQIGRKIIIDVDKALELAGKRKSRR